MSHLTPEELEAPPDSPHLQQCARCREAVRLARGRRRLVAGLKAYTLSEVAFSRVDARLMEFAREHPPGPRFSFGRLAAVAALAAVAGLLALTTVRPLLPSRPSPLPLAAFEPMTVVLASGVALEAGAVLQREAVVDALGGRVVLSTADGTALRLGGGARFAFGPPEATVRLLDGTLQVDARASGPWVVAAGRRWVRSSDATFDVAADTLSLFRGSVQLADDAAFNNARVVNAPAKVALASLAVEPLVPPTRAGLRESAPSPWARLTLRLSATEVMLDGQLVGGAPLTLLTSPGKHRLRARVDGAWREAEVELTTSGSGLVELPERPFAPPLPPHEPLAEADPAAIGAAIKAQLPKLRVCHDKWLKVSEGARGKVLMTVTVSPRGRVTRSSFEAAEGVPPSVSECLGRAVRAMVLPKSSEEVELEIPVLLGGQ